MQARPNTKRARFKIGRITIGANQHRGESTSGRTTIGRITIGRITIGLFLILQAAALASPEARRFFTLDIIRAELARNDANRLAREAKRPVEAGIDPIIDSE